MVGARLSRALLTAALALALLASACGGSSGGSAPVTPVAPANGVLSVRASEWAFEPPAIVLQAGEQVRIDFQNDGKVLHDLKVDGLTAGVVAVDNKGPFSGGENEVFISADPGERASITFVVQEAGSYTFYCTVRGHRQLGMEGDLIVR